MYFYHEHYHDAYTAAAEDPTSGDRRDSGQGYEPVRMPAIINWLTAVSVALLLVVAAIQALS